MHRYPDRHDKSSTGAGTGLAAGTAGEHDQRMQGLMQQTPLSTNAIFRRGERYWGDRTITTRTVTGLQRTTFAELARETRRVAGALDQLGIGADARVGSFAWNTARHLELYFAVPGTGRILHTINIRYFAEQLIYTIRHAEDEAVFVERSPRSRRRRTGLRLDCARGG